MLGRFSRTIVNLGRFLTVILPISPLAVQAQPLEPPGDIKVPKRSVWTDADYAGLPAASHPEVLTWERVYTLALIQLRNTLHVRQVDGSLPTGWTRKPSPSRPGGSVSPISDASATTSSPQESSRGMRGRRSSIPRQRFSIF